MGPPYAMSTRVYLPVHHRRPNWDRPSKFFTGHCPARHLLCSSPLPLRPIHRRSICDSGRVYPLIPTIYRIYPSLHLSQGSLRRNVRRCQPDFLPSTLPRPRRHASTILRLPRRLHTMKYYLLSGLTNLPNSRNHTSLPHLRSLRVKT